MPWWCNLRYRAERVRDTGLLESRKDALGALGSRESVGAFAGGGLPGTARED